MSAAAEASIKLIVLGEAGVGKTSILNQWLHGNFSEDTQPTIAAGLSPIQLMIDGVVHTFHVWDTAGTPQFRSVVPMYCRQAAIAVIVFDLTQRASFDTVPGWHSFVLETAQPVFLLVGNKVDLANERSVDELAPAELADRLGFRYVELSAKSGEGMRAFGRAVMECAREFESKALLRSEQSQPRIVEKKKEEEDDGCC
jgi:small GTP-binding protein